MIARIKQYFEGCGRRYQMLKEARAILQVLGRPAGTGPDSEVLGVLMVIGLGHLRSMKAQQDKLKAAYYMDALIKDPATPRPSFEEAKQN